MAEFGTMILLIGGGVMFVLLGIAALKHGWKR